MMQASKQNNGDAAHPDASENPDPILRRFHRRTTSIPFQNTSRKKPRRWPLALRFYKGAIHHRIIFPVLLHGLFAAIVVTIDHHIAGHHLGLPATIIPSLSIVVGLMLVFRNQTSYNRFWEGRNHISTVITGVRNLARYFLMDSYDPERKTIVAERHIERNDTEAAVKTLLAILYAMKAHLRADWGAFSDMSVKGHPVMFSELNAEYEDLVPTGLIGYSHKGLGVTLEFAALIEGYIKRGVTRGWWAAPQASGLTAQLNIIMDAYGKMETIRLTPVPIAHLIHQKQVLALFGAFLPFAMVTTMDWWAIPITVLVVFALYGIDVIASELEDPFGYDRNDIPLDGIVEDIRVEMSVMIDEWRKHGRTECIDGHTEEGGAWFVAEGVRSRVHFSD